jgi:hypothetical protein
MVILLHNVNFNVSNCNAFSISIHFNSASPSACTCACPHLLELLPGQLNLDFVRRPIEAQANPVHLFRHSWTHRWLTQDSRLHLFYTEGKRTNHAMQTPGLPETYHPFMKRRPLSRFLSDGSSWRANDLRDLLGAPSYCSLQNRQV